MQGLFGLFLGDDIADYQTARRGLAGLHEGDLLASTEGELAQTGLMDGSAWWRVGFWRCGRKVVTLWTMGILSLMGLVDPWGTH